MDIEWTHVMAPGASIDVFECPNSIGDEWNIAAVNAAKTPGVSVVSMSFGHDEFSGQTGYDGDFTTPSGHAGVTFVSSTGDSGEDNGHTSYAAESPNVVAVGGTVLYLANSSGDYGHEDGWAGSGGGISTQESQPSYQAGKVNGLSSSYRTVPDISMNAARANRYTTQRIIRQRPLGATTPAARAWRHRCSRGWLPTPTRAAHLPDYPRWMVLRRHCPGFTTCRRGTSMTLSAVAMDTQLLSVTTW